jgi:hypothetical protein
VTAIVKPASIGNTELAANLSAAKIANGNVSDAEFQYLDGVTSAIQTQIDTKQPKVSPVRAVTGTTETLLAADNGGIVTISNAADINLTVPAGLGAGYSVAVVQKGAGRITVVPSGTTVNNRQGHTKSAGQHAVITLFSDVANNFYLGGDTDV